MMLAAAKFFPCPPCAAEGVKLVQFDRDFVELKQGHPAHDPKNFVEITDRALGFSKRVRGTVKITGGAVRFSANPGTNPFPHPAGTLPHGFTACERSHPEVLKKISSCVASIESRPRSQQPANPFAVCRSSVACPPHSHSAVALNVPVATIDHS
jgi:hypothetical protein